MSSTLDRQRPGFHGERAYAAPLVLLAIAWSQVFVSLGRYSLAPQHGRWMAFGIFCVLVGLWYYQQAHANRVSH